MRRLSGTTRLLCLLGPLTVAVLLAVARWGLPYVWHHPRLAWAFSRPCALKAWTGVPCPFCGGTRATVYAVQGEWMASLVMNPMGVLLVVGGPLLALWLGACAVTGRDLGLTAGDRVLTGRWVASRVVIFIVALWLWKIALWLLLDV